MAYVYAGRVVYYILYSVCVSVVQKRDSSIRDGGLFVSIQNNNIILYAGFLFNYYFY